MLRNIAPLFAIVAGIMWGSIGLFVRALSALGLDNTTIVEVRMVGAAIMVFIGIVVYDKSLLRFKLQDFWIFLGASLASAFGINYFYTAAVNELSLSLAAILISTMPVFVIIISLFLFGERITPKKVGSMLLVVLGAICVSGVFDGLTSNPSVKGVTFGLLSGFGYALYSIFARFGFNRGYNALTINLYCFIITSLALMFFTNWRKVGEIIAIDPVYNIGFLLLHALICAAAPYVLFNLSLKYMDTGKASILASCEPVAATIFGFIFFDEIPTIISILGIAMVLVALGILSNPEKSIPKPG
ncbi:MAG: DMT family transporter [Desulfitobacteriia bacterium]|jgi:DME family drug/metabolite transporter